jgi:hypothetical protein
MSSLKSISRRPQGCLQQVVKQNFPQDSADLGSWKKISSLIVPSSSLKRDVPRIE